MYEATLVGYCGICLSFGAVWFCSYARSRKGGRDYVSEGYRNISKQAEKLKGIEFICADYRNLLIPEKSIIYCDPPYKGTDKYRGFEKFDHAPFYAWCREKAILGHKVFISEYWMPEDFICVWEKQLFTGNLAETKSKKVATEKLFVHFSQLL